MVFTQLAKLSLSWPYLEHSLVGGGTLHSGEMDGLWWSNHLLVGGAVLSHILVPTDHHPENTNTKPNERRPPGLWNRVNHQDICPVVVDMPPGHLPPPFLWHLPPLFLWHLPPPTFVHLPPGQLPPLNFFLIFHLFKRFKMTNFSLEVVMDEVLDM